MQKITEKTALCATVDPMAQAAGAQNTDMIDMSKFRRVLFIVATGTLGASATVDFGVYGDTASGGSFATLITGKSITQIVKASGDNVQVLVEVQGIDVAAQGLRYIRGKCTVGTATSQVAVIAIGENMHFQPVASVSGLNLSTVTIV